MVHTIVLGDTHGNWAYLLKALHHFRPDVCLVAGDFGWWPVLWAKAFIQGNKEFLLNYLLDNRPTNTEIRFIEGNHEDLEDLFETTEGARHSHEAVALRPGLWYQPRGSVYTLADGRTVFCCGGGKSVDAPYRKPGISWFPEEIVRPEELPQTLPKADIVLSHTVPNRFGVLETLPLPDPGWDISPDPTCAVLDSVYDAIRPSLWLASHLHVFRQGVFENTEYLVLNRTDVPGVPWKQCSRVLVR